MVAQYGKRRLSFLSHLYFHCVLHAKRGEGVQITFINGRPLRFKYWHSQHIYQPIYGMINKYKGPATRCDEMGHFPAILSFKKYRRPSQISPEKSQQCGQSACNDVMCQHPPAMLMAAMVI